MSFNPGGASSVDDKNVFVPEESQRVELSTNVVQDQAGHSVVVAVCSMIDEDHGIGHLLRHELQRDPQQRVSFAACRVPHPQEAVLQVRFHTTPNKDPQAILNDAIERCIQRIDTTYLALLPKK